MTYTEFNRQQLMLRVEATRAREDVEADTARAYQRARDAAFSHPIVPDETDTIDF